MISLDSLAANGSELTAERLDGVDGGLLILFPPLVIITWAMLFG